jgi:hypothetical protein
MTGLVDPITNNCQISLRSKSTNARCLTKKSPSEAEAHTGSRLPSPERPSAQEFLDCHHSVVCYREWEHPGLA